MNYKKNMKNFLCLLRRLFPTAPANSPANRRAQTHSRGWARRNIHNEIFQLFFFVVHFIYALFTRRHRVPRAHITSNKFNAVLCTLIHFMNAE